MSTESVLWVTAIMVISGLFIRPIRKTIGLLLVILGFIACLTFVGMIIGIPIILIGGLLLFI